MRALVFGHGALSWRWWRSKRRNQKQLQKKRVLSCGALWRASVRSHLARGPSFCSWMRTTMAG
jgi:hypothetical protein